MAGEMQRRRIEKIGDKMKDAEAKTAYLSFVATEQYGRTNANLYDQNRRIISAMSFMDAERIFKLVAETKASVKFSTCQGHGIELHFDDEFRVDPIALNQFDTVQLRKILKRIHHFTTSKGDETTYLKQIKKLLYYYRMITDSECRNIQNRLVSLGLTPEQDALLQDMRPGEAFRLRTVLNDLTDKYVDVYLFATTAFKLAEEYGLSSIADVADCIEILRILVNKKVNDVQNCQQPVPQATNVSTATAVDNNQIAQEFLNKLLADPQSTSASAATAVGNNEDPQSMSDLKASIDADCKMIDEILTNAHRNFGSSLSVYYHWKKHGSASVTAYYKMLNQDEPEKYTKKHSCEIYFQHLPEILFKRRNNTRRKEKKTPGQPLARKQPIRVISQDGRTLSRTYKRQIKSGGGNYKGFLCCESQRFSSRIARWGSVCKVSSHYALL